MTYKKENTASRKSPSRWQLSEARSGQYKGDYRFYKLFAQIWGWDGVKAKPEKAVNKLCKYIRREERKHPVKRQRPRDPELQFAVGVAYLSGWIPDEKYQNKAAMWFARSYEQGCDKGALGTGYIYERGMAESDPVTDYEHMVKAYTDAAKQKNVYAQYRLAEILHRYDPDNLMIIQMLRNAADAGYPPAKALLEKVNMRPGKTAVPDEQKDLTSKQYDKLYELLIEIKKNSVEGLEASHRIEAAVMMQQATLNDMWKDIQESNAEKKESLEELQKSVQETLEKAGAEKRTQAEKFLKLLFGVDWRNPTRLCDASCDALVDAHVLMAVAKKQKISNYAGIVITAVWALEHECRRRFYIDFFCYLQANKICEPDCLHLDSNKKKKYGFTLGSIPHIVKCAEYEPFAKSKQLSETARTIMANESYRSVSQVFTDYKLCGDTMTFTDIVEKLRDEYRNKAAHGHVLTRNQAAECCTLLGITEANKRKAEQADNDLAQVEGALKALLWLTAPLK